MYYIPVKPCTAAPPMNTTGHGSWRCERDVKVETPSAQGVVSKNAEN